MFTNSIKTLVLCALLFGFNAFGQPKGYSLKIDNTDLDRASPSPIHSYSPVLKQSTPAVVAVTTQQVVRRLYPNAQNPIEDLLRRYYGLPRLANQELKKKRYRRVLGLE